MKREPDARCCDPVRPDELRAAAARRAAERARKRKRVSERGVRR